jgi:hypothetical protein
VKKNFETANFLATQFVCLVLAGLIVMAMMDIETKAERSFDLDFVFDIEAKQTCKERSKVNPAHSTP